MLVGFLLVLLAVAGSSYFLMKQATRLNEDMTERVDDLPNREDMSGLAANFSIMLGLSDLKTRRENAVMDGRVSRLEREQHPIDKDFPPEV